MFGKKKSSSEATAKPAAEKLPGPRDIPEPVQKYLVAEKKQDPDIVRLLRALVRKSPKGVKAFDIRVFDDAEAVAKKIEVKDYTALDKYPGLTLFEGWFDQDSRQVELEEKKNVNYNVPILTEDQIRQKIEALTQTGSTALFYMARGPTSGGPLGRGAAVIEVNPHFSDKGQKKYIVYTADVDGTEPIGKGQQLFLSDKAKDVARWVKECHQKRIY
ncbi:MAG: hypothetical protein V1691_02250 [Chloroflexota bacterium]